MLPKVETRVVLVGAAGRNAALLKALQVYLSSPSPSGPPSPTSRNDHLLARTEAVEMEMPYFLFAFCAECPAVTPL